MQSDLKRAKCQESVFTIVCLIYEYTCVDTESEHCGKRYVGQTVQEMDARHSQHLTLKKTKFDLQGKLGEKPPTPPFENESRWIHTFNH